MSNYTEDSDAWALYFPNGQLVPDSITSSRNLALIRAEHLLKLQWSAIKSLGYRIKEYRHG
jgi:hypothetical protein